MEIEILCIIKSPCNNQSQTARFTHCQEIPFGRMNSKGAGDALRLWKLFTEQASQLAVRIYAFRFGNSGSEFAFGKCTELFQSKMKWEFAFLLLWSFGLSSIKFCWCTDDTVIPKGQQWTNSFRIACCRQPLLTQSRNNLQINYEIRKVKKRWRYKNV